ncbi:uncharacterized protein LOC124283111 [Haliotis rubra]|uniref:uncharacterized protein LOC124283111 n=1 Tax=Haliotis rubra TaxID=36100 RepID=UPI001EE52331|nr:uncharacterized protein LOC124283111 [Haliotis rubra]
MCTSLDNMGYVSLVAITTTIFYLTQAISFCSFNATNVHCLPCSDICISNTKPCFMCPVNCDHSCESVCSPFCLHGTCHYQQGQLMCSKGCQDGRAGISCQEFCPQDCQICDQFTSKCKEVKWSPPKVAASSEHRWLVIGPVLAVIVLLITTAGVCYKRRRVLGCLNRPLTFQTRHIREESGHRPAVEVEVPGNIYVDSVQMSCNPDQGPVYAIPDSIQIREDKEKYKYLTPIPQNLY